ncbi:hypothetical protein CDAR_389301 [Caerostris darwini]|uniref:Secreted protein n=1 Tax=Caerostris darwini TaxID=1538125 RepID=A0AAV4UY04_9ARAC|nr:hypothetical protein CDAR_389301 [Caerostris darwini]
MTHQQFLLDCITTIAHILLLKTLQCASPKSRHTFHCSKHYSARVEIALRTLHRSKQYTTQVQTLGTMGYRDDDQTITPSSIRQDARPNRD